MRFFLLSFFSFLMVAYLDVGGGRALAWMLGAGKEE